MIENIKSTDFDNLFIKQEYGEFGSINDLNSTLCIEDQFKVINRCTFKKMHRHEPCGFN